MYTIRRITDIHDIDKKLVSFLLTGAETLSKMYGDKFDWKNFDFIDYARRGFFIVCFKDDQPVGAILARLYGSIFDPQTKILMQDEFYVLPGSGRAAHLLMREFIDFGKLNANHVFTMIAEKTNIKRRSLEKLGFVKIEELYRLEF